MKLGNQLLLTLPLLFSFSMFFAQSNINWQLHHGQGEGIFVPGPNDPPVVDILNELTGGRQTIHGDPGGFQYAIIPAQDDTDWEAAPIDKDGDLCWRLDRSTLNTSFTVLDFTYFQTSFFVENINESFILRFYQVDDGARAYVFNSVHPEGAYIEGGDARIFASIAEIDISPLFVAGEENRIVIVQFDDSQTENFLKVETISEAELNSCEVDIQGPELFTRLADGSEIALSDLTFDELFLCGDEPSVNVELRDNCDQNPVIIDAISGIESINGDNTITYSVSFTAIDRSGNESTASYLYTALSDTEKPEIQSLTSEKSTFILDRCNEFMLTFEDLGLSISDNCTPPAFIDIQLSQTEFEEPGDAEITVTAIDEAGNESAFNVKVSFEPNPDFVSIVAGNDVLNKTAAEDGSIVLTEEELLANDTASDGSSLEIQDLTLLNPENGTLTDNNDGTYTFTPSEDFDGALELTYIAKSRNSALYFKQTEHFYEYVPFGTTWDDAARRAAARQINGIEGYLATITSQAENDFIFERLRGNGWIGASDAAIEGEWRWVTGPEGRDENGKGLLFWLGEDEEGMPIEGTYSNWGVSRFSGVEPNNLGNEDYAHFVFDLLNFFDESEIGKWNDFSRNNPSIDGFIVEYGDIGDCASKFVDEASVNVTIIINENDISIIDLPRKDKKIAVKGFGVQIFPNPLRKQTNLKVHLQQPSDLKLIIRDVQGQIVQQKSYFNLEAGTNNFELPLEELNQGIYLISIGTAEAERTMKMVVLE
ncbi:MAG: cadherin-like domain-containing protein [Bacteroidota bacterium]